MSNRSMVGNGRFGNYAVKPRRVSAGCFLNSKISKVADNGFSDRGNLSGADWRITTQAHYAHKTCSECLRDGKNPNGTVVTAKDRADMLEEIAACEEVLKQYNLPIPTIEPLKQEQLNLFNQ